MSDIIADGVALAHNFPIPGYGQLTESFYTAVGLYDPEAHQHDAVALVIDMP